MRNVSKIAGCDGTGYSSYLQCVANLSLITLSFMCLDSSSSTASICGGRSVSDNAGMIFSSYPSIVNNFACSLREILGLVTTGCFITCTSSSTKGRIAGIGAGGGGSCGWVHRAGNIVDDFVFAHRLRSLQLPLSMRAGIGMWTVF